MDRGGGEESVRKSEFHPHVRYTKLVHDSLQHATHRPCHGIHPNPQFHPPPPPRRGGVPSCPSPPPPLHVGVGFYPAPSPGNLDMPQAIAHTPTPTAHT